MTDQKIKNKYLKKEYLNTQKHRNNNISKNSKEVINKANKSASSELIKELNRLLDSGKIKLKEANTSKDNKLDYGVDVSFFLDNEVDNKQRILPKGMTVILPQKYNGSMWLDFENKIPNISGRPVLKDEKSLFEYVGRNRQEFAIVKNTIENILKKYSDKIAKELVHDRGMNLQRMNNRAKESEKEKNNPYKHYGPEKYTVDRLQYEEYEPNYFPY